MASDSPEASPLLPPAVVSPSQLRSKPSRNVTFDPNPVIKTIQSEPERRRPRTAQPSSQRQRSYGSLTSSIVTPSTVSASGTPVIETLNNRLRRRNSHGSASPAIAAGHLLVSAPLPVSIQPKIGPQRSSKTAQKLKLLPTPEIEEDEVGEQGGEVYSQYTRIKDPSARRDAARLGKADRERLPRVTAYCTANRYQMDSLLRFLNGRGKTRGADPKLIEECIYTPYSYGDLQEEDESGSGALAGLQPNPAAIYERRHSTGEVAGPDGDFHRDHLVDMTAEGDVRGDGSNLAGQELADDNLIMERTADLDIHVGMPEVFLFEYGVVVIWGMSIEQEQRFLKEIAKFETEKLAPDDVETEFFNFYYTREYQARIYNDFIALRHGSSYMTKLAISHALAQSVKTSLFEEVIASTIDECKDIPAQIALTGKIALSRRQINMQIGELFILRISIHLNGSVLDTPELFWVEPQLEPVYQAVRSYLEMDQRVGLLTDRLDVIADLLAVLKDQLSHGHGEKLEWIVIILIAAEILVAAVNIVVDLVVGVD